MKNLAEEFETLLDKISKKELRKNYEALKKYVELKEFVNKVKNSELSKGNPMLKFINAKNLLEN